MSYAVGQVVFLLLQKELKVIPAMVVEQTVTRTLDGEKTSFSVVVPSPSKDSKPKKYPLEKLGAKVYTTVDHARSAMIENATSKINSILRASEVLAKENFQYDSDSAGQINENAADEPEPRKDETHVQLQGDDVISDIMSLSDVAEIDLGNGMKAKINPKNITLS